MRVSISPRGSVRAMPLSSLPARLDHAGDLATGGQLTQHVARKFQLAINGAGAAGQFAAVAYADLGRVARQFGQLQGSLEALLRCRRLALHDSLQPVALGRELRGHLLTPLVLSDRTRLRH